MRDGVRCVQTACNYSETSKGANVKLLIACQMQVVLSCVGGRGVIGGVGGPYTLCGTHFLLCALEGPVPRRLEQSLETKA